MSISFNSIPSGLLVPFVAVEFDASRAQQGPALLRYRALLIGQKTDAGTGEGDELYRISSESDVIDLAGRGSLAHRMARSWFRNDGQITETWLALLEDSVSGDAAAGSIAVTGPATASGIIALYIGGERIEIAVTSGDAATAIAAAINAAINANTNLPVTATVDTAAVTITARNAGLYGNEIDLRVNYNDGEKTPAGVGLTVTAMANGAANPSLTNVITAMGDTWFHIIANPYRDATSLTALETELSSRNGPLRMIDGYAFCGINDTQNNLISFGTGRNSQFTLPVGQRGSPTPPYETAAAVAAKVAAYGSIDPGRPFTSLPLVGVLPPQQSARLTLAERNILIANGIGTLRYSADGGMEIERLVTTYKLNSAGSADTAYRDANTLLTLMYLRYSFRVQIAAKYPRHKLADDGSRASAGQALMTPSVGKAEAIGWFRDMERLVLVENFETFKANLIVVRNDQDPNRLDFLLPPDLINQLLVVAAQIQFRL